MKTFLPFILFLCLCACGEKDSRSVQLKKNEKKISLELDESVKTCSRALYLYTDKDGKEYITFQNDFKNEIYFYDFKTQALTFKFKQAVEGNNGVGGILGYYIQDLNHIYLTSDFKREIYLVDTAGMVKEKFQYKKTIDDIPLSRSYSATFRYHPFEIIGNKMYGISGCDRKVAFDPISFTIDLETKEIKHLPFEYLTPKTEINPAKKSGSENSFSREFDGSRFIYSFSYEEDLYIASIDHQTITQKPAKSKYIEKLVPFDDFGNVTFEGACEHAEYGNLLYDKYRNVYYRVAFPQTDVPHDLKDREYMDLLVYGRKTFSILVLDKNLDIIGETQFPDYTYNPMMMFVHKDGLYISASHPFNENYSDDWLHFQCFELVKE